MAKTRDWDETAPAGSAAANTLDTIIQELKIDIRERMEDVLPNWVDQDDDPQRIVIHTGTTKPSSTDANVSSLNAGEFFLDTDDDILYLYNGTDWVAVSGVIVDLEANRPSAASVAEGTLFWSSDEDKFYIQEGTAWVRITVAAQMLVGKFTNRPDPDSVPEGTLFFSSDTGPQTYVSISESWQLFLQENERTQIFGHAYDDAQAGGSKEVAVGNSPSRRRKHVVHMDGSTDGSGQLVLDLGELTATPQIDSIITVDGHHLIHVEAGKRGAGLFTVARLKSVDAVANTITITFFDDTGATLNSTPVEALVSFYSLLS